MHLGGGGVPGFRRAHPTTDRERDLNPSAKLDGLTVGKTKATVVTRYGTRNV